MRFFYKQYGDAKRELVEKIKEIEQELERLHAGILHAKDFAAPLSMEFEDFKAKLMDSINLLGMVIKDADLESNTEEISLMISQFNADSLKLTEMLEIATEIPSLKSEEVVFNNCLNDFEKFAENLPDDPSRRQVLVALREASELLKEVNKGIALVNQNLASECADVLTTGALVATELKNVAVVKPAR